MVELTYTQDNFLKNKKNINLYQTIDGEEDLEKDYNFSNLDNDKFTEIAFSLAYYLKLFSNLNRFLEYIKT